MSVRVGSRVDQLLALRQRVEVELQLARRNAIRGDVPYPPTGRTPQPAAPAPTPALAQEPSTTPPIVRVPLFVVTPGYVRIWASTQGFDVKARGPLHSDVLDAFQEAHQ